VNAMRCARDLTSVVVGLVLSWTAMVSLAAAQPAALHVTGNFCSTCTQFGSHNQLYDDGLHNDAAANDGIWGVDITSDQPAGSYWFRYTSNPTGTSSDYPKTQACTPTLVAQLWTTGPGDVIHFRLGGPHTNPSGTYGKPGEWFPDYAMSADHATPPGAGISFRLNSPVAPSGFWLVPATRHGSIWLSEWRIPDELAHFGSLSGTYWVSVIPGLNFTYSYNAFCYYMDEDPTALWSLTAGRTMWLVFDETTGQFQSSVLAPTPIQRSSWGALKEHYR